MLGTSAVALLVGSCAVACCPSSLALAFSRMSSVGAVRALALSTSAFAFRGALSGARLAIVSTSTSHDDG